MQFCMLHYWFASSQQLIVNTLLCSWFFVSDLIFSCKKFWVWWICSNFPTKRDYDGSSETIENICWIWFSLNNKISWTTNRRLIYSSTFRLSLWWISFSTLRRKRKQLKKDIGRNELSLSCLDPRIKECELEVQRIFISQLIILCFIDRKRVTKKKTIEKRY